MRITLFTCCIGLFLYMTTAAEPLSNIAKAEEPALFQTTQKETMFAIVPYLASSQSQISLDANQNSNTVIAFTWWLNRFLEKPYMPTDEFIAQNICLYPSNKEHSEDVASLAFSVGKSNLRIIQTGGPGGRFCILADTGNAVDADVDHAKASIEDAIMKMLRGKTPAKVVNISLMSTNRAYLAVGTFDGVPIKCLIDGKDICISIPKALFQETVPAREPMPNEWFKWERGLAPYRKSK